MDHPRRARWLATTTARVAVTAVAVAVGWVVGVAVAGGGAAEMLAWLGGYWGVPLAAGVVIYWALPKPSRLPHRGGSPRRPRGGERPGGTLGGVPGGGPPTTRR